jgi:hypothetical protein
MTKDLAASIALLAVATGGWAVFVGAIWWLGEVAKRALARHYGVDEDPDCE